MSYAPDYESYGSNDGFAINAAAGERATFIRKTYAHLFLAIAAFACLCGFFLNTPAIARPMIGMAQSGQWLLILGGFLVVSWVASWMAASGASQTVQYAGLILYTVAQAVIFVPILWIANQMAPGGHLIMQAGALTLLIFGGLTVVVFMTGADFSFLRTGLWVGGIAAFALIVVASLMGFSLGLWFVAAMVILMAGYILYDTSNILHHYRTDQHVAAALALFASVATMFWYVLRLVMAFSNRD